MKIDRPIAIALILFATLLVVFFLTAPQYEVFKGLRQNLAEKRAEYNAQLDYYTTIAKVYDQLKSRTEDIAKIDDALPTNSELGQVVYFFQKTAAENGIVIKNLYLSKTGNANSKSNVKEIVFSLDLLGNFSSLKSFMFALEKSARLFEVVSISFGSSYASQNLSSMSSASQFQSEQMASFNLQIKTQSY